MYEHFPVFNDGLGSLYDGWAKCKEKVPDQIPIKMFKQEATPNSSLNNLKIIFQKGAEKLVKDEYM